MEHYIDSSNEVSEDDKDLSCHAFGSNKPRPIEDARLLIEAAAGGGRLAARAKVSAALLGRGGIDSRERPWFRISELGR